MTIIFQHLPGDKVKIFHPIKKRITYATKEAFDALQGETKDIQFLEYTHGDIAHEFEMPNGEKIHITSNKNK